MKPPYNPDTVNQTVDYGGITWKGQPGGDWVQQSVTGGSAISNNSGGSSAINMPSNSGQMPSKADINPETGKAYAINPSTGVWDDNYWANTVEPTLKSQNNSQGGGTIAGQATSGAIGIAQPTIDIPKLYQGLYASSGISNIERALSDKTNSYNEQVSKIKDNPYLSEATLTGRISKLTDKFNADKANIQNDISMRKADVETQLNLQTKQFDIQSNQAQVAWQQFNTLLQAGSLDNASGEDIANLTRATGISSSMIQSAIGVSKAKNTVKPEKVNTQVIQVDDGDNVYAVVMNQDTGQIINKQLLAKSAPTATEQKAATGGSATSSVAAQQKQVALDKAQAPKLLAQDVKSGWTLGTLMNFYQGYGLSKQQIYDAYRSVNYYKATAAQQKADKAKYGVK